MFIKTVFSPSTEDSHQRYQDWQKLNEPFTVFHSTFAICKDFLVNTRESTLKNTEQWARSMVQVSQTRVSASLKKTTDQILSQGQLNRQEYAQMTSLLLSNHKITAQERRTVNHIFDSIKKGTIKVFD